MGKRGTSLQKLSAPKPSQKKQKSEANEASTSAKEANAAESAMSLTEEKALQWIWDFLSKPENRHQILYAKANLEGGMCDNSAQRDIQQKEVFHHTYTTWKSLPKYFIAEILVDVCMFSKEFVDHLDVGGQGQLRAAFTCIFGISDFAWWPPALREFLRTQVERMGNRHLRLKTAVSGDGKIHWPSAMGYTLHWEDVPGQASVLKQISHVSGATADVTMVVITSEFQLQEPWDDMRAMFCGHPTIKPHLVDFFPKDVQFRKFWGKPFFQAEAKALEEAWSKRQANAKATTDMTILKSRDAQRKAAAKASAAARVPTHKMMTPIRMQAAPAETPPIQGQ